MQLDELLGSYKLNNMTPPDSKLRGSLISELLGTY